MELRRLRYFVTLARHGHFGRAADELGIAQPGLTQQIKVLERELKVSLIRRQGRSFGLTPAGQALLGGAESLLAAADSLVDDTRLAAAGAHGRLRIAYTRSGSDTAIGPRVREFRDQHAGIAVSAVTGWTEWNISLLEAGEVDVIFVRGNVRRPNLVTEYVDDETSILVVAPDHRLAQRESVDVAEIRDEPFVMWTRDTGPEFYDELVGHIWGDRTPTIVAEEPDAEQVIAAVAAGVGIGVLDERRTRRMAGADVVRIPFSDNPPRISVQMAWLADEDNPVVQTFLAWWHRDH